MLPEPGLAPHPRSCPNRCAPWCGSCCGATLIIVAWVFGALFVFDKEQPTLHKVVNSLAATSTEQKFYDVWKDHSIGAHITMYYYLWNVTNALDAMNVDDANGTKMGAKPIVQPIGPFAYTQYNTKSNVRFHDDGNKVSYNYNIEYVFDPDRSGPGLTEQTQVWMPNLPLMGAYWRAANAKPFAVSSMLGPLCLNWNGNDDPTDGWVQDSWRSREIVNYTAKQWLWAIEDPLVMVLESTITQLSAFGPAFDPKVRVQPEAQVCEDCCADTPVGGHGSIPARHYVKNATTCWRELHTIQLQFNNTADFWNHTTTQWTGKDDPGKAGQLVEWEGCPTVGKPGSCDAANRYWGIVPAVGGGDFGTGGEIGDCSQFGEAACGATPERRLYCAWGRATVDGVRQADSTCHTPAEVADAGRVAGTDGYQQRPDMGKLGGRASAFIDQAWRRFELERVADCEVHGVKCGKYAIMDENWQPGDANAANAGYLPSEQGLLNYTTVQAGPIYLSQPYFAQADRAESLVDMRPVPGCDEEAGPDLQTGCIARNMKSFFQYEEWTGLGVSADVGLQINIRVRDVDAEWTERCGDACQKCCDKSGTSCAPLTSDGKKWTKGMREAYYPMVTIRQSVQIKEKYTDRLKSQVLDLIDGVKTASTVMLPLFTIMGAAMLGFSVLTLVRRGEAPFDRFGRKTIATGTTPTYEEQPSNRSVEGKGVPYTRSVEAPPAE